jgi:hypothetical protein
VTRRRCTFIADEQALQLAVTAPALREIGAVQQTGALAAYRARLADPDALLERSMEEAFAPLAGEAEWSAELTKRYPTLCKPALPTEAGHA